MGQYYQLISHWGYEELYSFNSFMHIFDRKVTVRNLKSNLFSISGRMPLNIFASYSIEIRAGARTCVWIHSEEIYFGNASAYRQIVSPRATNFSAVPVLIPDFICLATIGGPWGNSASTEQTNRQELRPLLTIEYWVQLMKVFPYGTSGVNVFSLMTKQFSSYRLISKVA